MILPQAQSATVPGGKPNTQIALTARNYSMSQSKPFLTIVSGLPRSGTSMMMRMLEAGGMEVLIDNIRRADDDNPRGYYEFEPVKQTRRDASWIGPAQGKAVKMVYRLLYDLPANFEYRVLFMRRNLDEVLASQKKMLARGDSGDDVPDGEMSELFRAELARFDRWIVSQGAFKIIDVRYNELLANPTPIVAQIAEFLDGGFDQQAMCGVVDPTLYRNRS